MSQKIVWIRQIRLRPERILVMVMNCFRVEDKNLIVSCDGILFEHVVEIKRKFSSLCQFPSQSQISHHSVNNFTILYVNTENKRRQLFHSSHKHDECYDLSLMSAI